MKLTHETYFSYVLTFRVSILNTSIIVDKNTIFAVSNINYFDIFDAQNWAAFLILINWGLKYFPINDNLITNDHKIML